MKLEVHVTMAKNTNKILVGLLALSAGFVLAACDTVNALPKSYENPIVARDPAGDYTLTDNQLGKIWEAIVSGKAEQIHNEIIYEIAESQFGVYFTKKEGETVIEKGISEITSETDIKAFIAKHASVFIKDNDAILAKSTDENVIYSKVRKPRFEAFKKDIEERLADKLYSEISSGNFNDKQGRFSELKLALAHYFSGYDIKKVSFDANGVAEAGDWYSDFITSSISKEDLTSIKTVVHVERFEDYLNKKVIRDIYSEKLIEEYVLQNKYSTLGRAYARHASYVKLAYSDDNKVFANDLMQKYADEVIVKGEEPNEEKVANTWRGLKNIHFDSTSGELTEIEAGDDNYNSEFALTTIKSNFTAAELTELDPTDEEQIILDYEYIKESKVGELFERYVKALRAVIDGAHHIAEPKDQSELDSFTGSNSHGRLKGIKDELSKLVLEDYTVNEWGLKNGGFSDLPSSVRDRLFNINVANTVDYFTDDVIVDKATNKKASEYAEDSDTHMGRYATTGIYSYVRYIKGHYYLNKTDAQRYEDNPYSYIFDVDNSLIVVNIKDAANSTKLNVEHEKSYFKTKGEALFTENTAREIAKLLGTKESYKSDAYEHYLEKYNLNFSDQEAYDYFVANYPDLYGEDD